MGSDATVVVEITVSLGASCEIQEAIALQTTVIQEQTRVGFASLQVSTGVLLWRRADALYIFVEHSRNEEF